MLCAVVLDLNGQGDFGVRYGEACTLEWISRLGPWATDT